MSRRLKQLVVEELRQAYEGVSSCLVVDLHRADGEQAVALRRYLAERGIRLQAVKNSLAVRALAQVGMGDVERYLDGPCALASGGEDLLALARAFLECAREHRVLAVRGGVSEGRPVEASQIEELARMGSLEALRATVVGALAAPLRQVAAAFAAPLGGLARVLQQVAQRPAQ